MKTWQDLDWFKGSDLRMETRLRERPFLPRWSEVYNAFALTPWDKVRVVIMGQDPYPTPGHAHGLAFSVLPSVKPIPPTLRNVFKELCSDVHVPYPKNGCLIPWAAQGVLLWNANLTVSPYRSGSHSDLGWSQLTEEVLRKLEAEKEGLVFVLWGREAQRHLHLVLPSVETKRHSVILSSHPSPLSARHGFFGSRPFSTINSRVKGDPINWRLP